MDWDTYRAQVATSRELIAFPFFEKHLSKRPGIGIDLGCGNGELTALVAGYASGKVVGIDVDEGQLREARGRYSDIHFIRGDVQKNVLPLAGLTFDYAFSNCCFCHLSDEGVYDLFMDLYSCMRDSGELVFLVPDINWAKDKYDDVEYVKSGISAVPRFGGRQFFRTSEWYASALEKCGFQVVLCDELKIPEDERLEERYRSSVGRGLLTAFVAKRLSTIPNAESLQKAFEVAHDNRKLEIQLFWQRSLFFWGFVSAALIAYSATANAKSPMAIVFALFGLVCSVVWSAGNRGSKYWQEYWERKVNFFQHYVTGNIFYDREPRTARFLNIFSPRRVSVSKLTMALSDYAVFLWLAICADSLFQIAYGVSFGGLKTVAVSLVIFTLMYCLIFLHLSDSED